MNVDLAPLKTLFPQSITFDCYCTKGKVVNIRASFVGGGGLGVGVRKTVFANTALASVKQEKKL